MKPEDLEPYLASKPEPESWVSVDMDTGGIAAGAKDVFDALQSIANLEEIPFQLKSCGSRGLSFADPVIEVKAKGMPAILYGNVGTSCAARIADRHLRRKRILDDYAIATRQRASEFNGESQTCILVKDTAPNGDRTAFFQSCIAEELKIAGLADQVQVCRAFDMGLYDRGLCMQLLPSGVTYANVLSPDIRRIVAESLQQNRVVEDLLAAKPDPQEKIVLRYCGHIDPDEIDDYLSVGGYQALKKVLTASTPEETIEAMKQSGLRGRGGAGFPTWLKWKLTREPASDRKYVICNADEGDPGAFMDRSVLEGDPHSVLEGLMIAAYCIGADKGYFYIRAEYPLAVERVRGAIAQAREKGLLGNNILGTDFSFDADVRLGAGAFVCGEETALIASIEGKRGSPTPRPPFPSVSGLWGKPTSINNVETLAAVPAIIGKGADWYAGFGTATSRGTKVFAVTGKVRNAQLVEVPMGATLRTVIYDVCGGVEKDHHLKAIQTGGPSGGVIPESLLDTEISYESLAELGSIMGSGGMLVMDDGDSMVEVAKFYLRFCVDESCGKCAPCRIGGFQMLQILQKITRGLGDAEDISQLRRICSAMKTASLCGLGQTAPNPVLSTLKYFEDEYTKFIEGGPAYARKHRKMQASLAAS